MASITAKSVIIGIADNWGDPSCVGFRQIDFYLVGNKLPLTPSDYTVYVSSENSSQLARYAFDTTLSKIGTNADDGWRTATGKSNQWLVVVFNTPQEIDGVVINNYHGTGGLVNRGVRNIVITTSTDEIISTVYAEAITNSTEIFSGVIPEHTAVDEADDYAVPIVIPTEGETTEYTFPVPDSQWTMDNIDGTTIKDEYGLFDLTNEGMALAPMKFDNGAFSGGSSGNKITAPTEIAFSTLCMWISRNNTSLYGNILADTGTAHVIALRTTGDNRIYCYNSDLAGYFDYTDLVVADTELHFLCIREVEDSDHYDICLDGVWSSTSLNVGLGGAFKHCGRSSSSSGQEAVNFDNICKYDRVLTDEEVSEVFASALQLPTVIGGDPDPPLDTTSIRNLVDQQWSSLGVLVRALLDQQYYFASAEIRALFRQSTTNTVVIRNLVEQLYEDCAKIRSRFEQLGGSTKEMRAEIIQTWDYLTAMRAELDQRYSLASSTVRAELEQVYDLNEFDAIRAELEQIYILAAGEAIILRDDISVTAIVGGERHILESCHNITDQADEEDFCQSGELQLADENEYVLCRSLETVIEIVDNGELQQFIVQNPRRVRGGDGVNYIIPLVSESILLDHNQSAYAVVNETKLAGMRRDIVTALAAPVCAVLWQDLPNDFITIYPNDETAKQLIQRIVESVRGVVQSAADGSLICRREYPDDIDKLFDRPADRIVTDQDDFFQISPQDADRDGFNSFFVSDTAVSSGGLRIEVKELSALESEIRVFMSPWQEYPVVLHHSSGDWVSIIENGVVFESQSEQVEFIGGAGALGKPCFGDLIVEYSERDLGEVSFVEDGTLTADLADNSLAEVVYLTKYHSFVLRTDRIEDVQVYPEVIYE